MRSSTPSENRISRRLPEQDDRTAAGRAKKAMALAADENPDQVKVSAVIITFNEESLIERTLNQLWWCDEIIIIDSFSTDKTTDICEEFGCSVFSRAFNGFGEQKAFGVSKAKNDWVLCIDADEVLTESLIDEIRNALKNDEKTVAYSIPRNLVFMKRVFRHGKETSSEVIRLFNKNKGSWDGSIVHEKVDVNGPVKNLKHKILHYSYHDYHQFLSKINLYSTLGAQKLFERGAKKSRMLTVLAIPFNFVRYYFIDRNFLNGYQGFSWAILNTCYHFVKYLKLEELRKNARNK
jgi:glycosyltransferase involved in cell wall biosynthesis